MTFMSLYVSSDEQLGSRADHNEVRRKRVLDLAPYARSCPPHKAAAWARARSLRVHFRDNCWVEIDVTKDDLLALASELGVADDVRDVISSLPHGARSWVLTSEEF